MENITLLCSALLSVVSTTCSGKEFELTPQDGWYNNLIHPDWGAIDGHLVRRSPVAFSDGVYEPSGKDRPNPFIISKEVHDGPAGLGSLRNRTAFLVYFVSEFDRTNADPPKFIRLVPPVDDTEYIVRNKSGISKGKFPVIRGNFCQRD